MLQRKHSEGQSDRFSLRRLSVIKEMHLQGIKKFIRKTMFNLLKAVEDREVTNIPAFVVSIEFFSTHRIFKSQHKNALH